MTRRGPRALPAARAVGSLLALTAAATVAAAVGRVSAGADQPALADALADALAAIAGHAWRYGAGVARRPANAAGAPRRGADSRLRPPVR